MKKNGISRHNVSCSENKRQTGHLGNKIPVLLLGGICLLAVSIFLKTPGSIQKNTRAATSEYPGKYIFVTGSTKTKEGLYFLTAAELQKSFPELLPLVVDSLSLSGPAARVTAVHYQSGRPETVNPPPAVSNIFFMPIPINRADKEILSSLPGIGPVLAERIIQRRTTAGPFTSKNDLLQVSGLGRKKLARLQDHIFID